MSRYLLLTSTAPLLLQMLFVSALLVHAPSPPQSYMHHVVVRFLLQVVVPSLGESITDGTIAAVLKAAGDSVKENETIAQIETDKVTIDIKAPSDGIILGVVVQEQETVLPGQLVATLDDAAAQVGWGSLKMLVDTHHIISAAAC